VNFNYIFTIIDRTSKWMEDVPLSDTSAAACAKALTFTWFPVLALLKRSLLIAARNLLQTFALNCARCFTSPTNKQPLTILSRMVQSKGCTAATWSEELPFVLLGLQAQQREDTGLSLAEAVFGAPLCYLMNFCKTKKCKLMLLSKIV
jgi:hypothetical protein